MGGILKRKSLTNNNSLKHTGFILHWKGSFERANNYLSEIKNISVKKINNGYKKLKS